MEKNLRFFQKHLLLWFINNGRMFPWRKGNLSNYEYIIAEVLLQRTKAETIAKFYPLFIEKYRSWEELGNASEKELQEQLKPIGLYKQRGTRLYKLAQEIKNRKGVFPINRENLEELPMMGQYIANAYELFVLKKQAPLLDVNMARVLERFFGKRKLADLRYDPYLQSLAKNYVKHKKSKELNWAILDYAALICKPKPLCENCSLKVKCRQFKLFMS